MPTKTTVLSALAAALALGAAEAEATLGPSDPTTNNEAVQAQAPVVSEAAREMLLQVAANAVVQSKRLDIAQFTQENGPSFVQSRPAPK